MFSKNLFSDTAEKYVGSLWMIPRQTQRKVILGKENPILFESPELGDEF